MKRNILVDAGPLIALFDLKSLHWERLIQLTKKYADFYIYRTIRIEYLKNVL